MCGSARMSPSVMNCTRAGDQVGDRARLSLVADHLHRDAGVMLEDLGGEMHHGTARGTGVRELPGPPLCVGHEFLQRGNRQRCRDDEHERARADERDRLEIAQRIVAQRLRSHARLDRRRRARREPRVPVRRALCHELGRDVAIRPGLRLDDDRLPECRRDAIGDEPRNDVELAAGRKRHDQTYRLVRPPRLGGHGQRCKAPRALRRQRRRSSDA